MASESVAGGSNNMALGGSNVACAKREQMGVLLALDASVRQESFVPEPSLVVFVGSKLGTFGR